MGKGVRGEVLFEGSGRRGECIGGGDSEGLAGQVREEKEMVVFMIAVEKSCFWVVDGRAK